MTQARYPLSGDKIILTGEHPVTIDGLDDCARFSLRIAPSQSAAASAALGLDLPVEIGGIASSTGRLALCLGPDEWFVLAAKADGAAIVSAFAEIYGQAPHSLVDVSHRETGIVIDGPLSALVLQSGIAFDLAAMPVGTGCRTLLDKAQIILMRETANRFRIEVWHSFSEHIWNFLAAVRREPEFNI
ncbi:sarcosine oxidase [Novosphingobium flavum]|uniref:Sarcosine oxidase n=1 Tax=Novosphingobium aerophilum TaxID=2839843 RepID=A0A7X1F9B4_9SPHN|nr:sarcosine oxidase subunit gamma family protein [Novosphingobium aerophilum]MBC2652768.1 sarcosine oxidase [Novosphingobium aerophilum]MBC2660841.1 sarcosine oxidase [Novosphingobium aerophilum]